MFRKPSQDKSDEPVPKMRIYKRIACLFVAALIPAADFYLLELYTHNPFTTMGIKPQLLNVLFYELFFLLWLTVSARVKTALTITTVLSLIVGLGNCYVMRFRENPIVPWDIFSLKTALSVADNYSFRPDGRMVWVTLGLVFLLLSGILAGRQADGIFKPALPLRLGVGACILTALFIFTKWIQPEENHGRLGLYDKLFTPIAMMEKDGFAVTFLIDLQYLFVERPAGYDAEEQKAVLQEYDTADSNDMTHTSDMTESSYSPETYPDIIVIMNEAFSDVGILGELNCSEDYMPFIHSLQESDADNIVTGYLNVSVLGGNTANTEFEFLTGNTMAFLPAGSVPYQQYMRNALPTLVSHLKSLGYITTAMHPYHAGGWNRETVYGQYMGFDEMLFLDDFKQAERIRKYVIDSECYEKAEDILEQGGAAPQFVFVVTMQNHGSYTKDYDNFVPDITVEGSKSAVLSKYLSLIKISDEALEQLIHRLEKRERRTVVLFFGDHQPNSAIANPVLKLSGKSVSALTEEEAALQYEVPYLIWGNFPLDRDAAGFTSGTDNMSVNYLSGRLLQAAGVPLSDYQRFLCEVEKDYPVISAVRTVEGASGANPETLAAYQKMQYYRLMDAVLSD